ncbi:hypothetical protein Hanom_Chr03g00192301 [Helianthus anomalus]
MKHGDGILHGVPVPGTETRRGRLGDVWQRTWILGTSTKPYPILGTSKTEYQGRFLKYLGF